MSIALSACIDRGPMSSPGRQRLSLVAAVALLCAMRLAAAAHQPAGAEPSDLLQQAVELTKQIKPPFDSLALEQIAAAFAEIGDAESSQRTAQGIVDRSIRESALRRLRDIAPLDSPAGQASLLLDAADLTRLRGDRPGAQRMLVEALRLLEGLPRASIHRGWILQNLIKLQQRLKGPEAPRVLTRVSLLLRTNDAAVVGKNLDALLFEADRIMPLAWAQIDIDDRIGAEQTVRSVLAQLKLREADGDLALTASLAELEVVVGDVTEAERLISRARELARQLAPIPPERRGDAIYVSQAMQHLAVAQWRLGDTQGSRASFLSAVAAMDARNKRLVPKAQAEAGDLTGALQTARTLSAGALAQALEFIAAVQAQTGDVNGAIETAGSIEPNQIRAAALAHLAGLQAEAGDPRGSSATFRRARQASPLEVVFSQALSGDTAGALEGIAQLPTPQDQATALLRAARGIARRRAIERVIAQAQSQE